MIESDYQKLFVCGGLMIDANQDGKFSDEERFFGKNVYVSIDYKDFDSAGNLITISTSIDGSDLSKKVLFEDVEFMRIKMGDIPESFILRDSLGDDILFIMDTSGISDGKVQKMLAIFNLSVLF